MKPGVFREFIGDVQDLRGSDFTSEQRAVLDKYLPDVSTRPIGDGFLAGEDVERVLGRRAVQRLIELEFPPRRIEPMDVVRAYWAIVREVHENPARWPREKGGAR